MKYRRNDKLGVEVSALGFGCMRLPVVNNDFGAIDEPEAIRMIRHAIDKGVNYLDTAYPYHRGNSELLVAKVIKDGYREKVYIADKLPMWEVKTAEDADRLLEEQLGKLEVETIDFYLLHALNRGHWETVKKFDLIRWGEQKKKEGKIRFFGFSFHDGPDVFKEIVDGHTWDFCQIQYNFMDEHDQAGRMGLDYAHSKGIGVIIMEPLRGGDIVRNLPDKIMDIYKNHKPLRAPVDWAFRWLWDQEKVWFVLSGMSLMTEVEEDLKLASEAEVGCLTDDDREMIEQVKKVYLQLRPVNCTFCRYCQPCPKEIFIPWIFSIYNDWFSYNNKGKTRAMLQMIAKDKRPSECIECGKCVEACPQGLDVIGLLKDVDKLGKELGVE